MCDNRKCKARDEKTYYDLITKKIDNILSNMNRDIRFVNLKNDKLQKLNT